MKNVSRDVILSLPFPLPPLVEQHRIVAKVVELMALCDRLEASLSTADDARGRMLRALLRRLRRLTTGSLVRRNEAGRLKACPPHDSKDRLRMPTATGGRPNSLRG